MPPLSAILFTIGILALWILTLVWAWRVRPFYAFALAFATAFFFFCEYASIRGGQYYYGDFPLKLCASIPAAGIAAMEPLPVWLVAIFTGVPGGACVGPNLCIPVAVAMMEGVLMIGVLFTTDRLTTRRYFKPFIDAFGAVNIDVFLDPVAAYTKWCGPLPDRGIDAGLGFWTWLTSPDYVGRFYGIPMQNFLAWYVAVIAFTISVRVAVAVLPPPGSMGSLTLTEILHDLWLALKQLIGMLILFFTFMYVGLLIINYRNTAVWQVGFIALLMAVGLVLWVHELFKGKRDNPYQWVPMTSQLFVLLFCVGALIFAGPWDHKPMLWVVGLVTTLIGVTYAYAPFSKR